MAERGIFYGGIALQRAAKVSDGKGGFAETYATVSSPRGRITPLSLAETERAMQTVGVVTHRFSCASSVDVRTEDHVVYSGRTYKIQAVSITSSGERKQCLAEEVAGGH